MFYFMFILIILSALFFHDQFYAKIETVKSTLFLIGLYGSIILLFLIFLKMIQGWGWETTKQSFQSIGNLFKYGTVALFLAAILPLLAAFVRDYLRSRKKEKKK